MLHFVKTNYYWNSEIQGGLRDLAQPLLKFHLRWQHFNITPVQYSNKLHCLLCESTNYNYFRMEVRKFQRNRAKAPLHRLFQNTYVLHSFYF